MKRRLNADSKGEVENKIPAPIVVKESNGAEVHVFSLGLTADEVADSKSQKRLGTSESRLNHSGNNSSPTNAYTPRRPFYTQWVSALMAPLLPEGYPHSVSPDYASYQMWDTMQCLCSSVTGALSTRAVLMGVGVGHAEATALSGTLSWLIRDVWSKVGAVWFAAYFATDLDNDAKRWRYVADLANDAGLFLEIFSVHLPPAYFMLCACVACLFKAVCGVAGGSSKTSLTQHFSLRHNMADVAAKDGSQETVASLIGMFMGMFVAWLIPETNFFGTCLGYFVFTSLHLYTNYRAVTSLVLTHFNRHRARHAIVGFLEKGGQWEGRVMDCVEANRRESVLILSQSSREPFEIACGARPSDIIAFYSRKGRGKRMIGHEEAKRAVIEALAHIGSASTSSSARRFAVIADVHGKRYDVLLGRREGDVVEGEEEEALLWAYYCVCVAHYGSFPPTSGKSGAAGLSVLFPRDDDGFSTFKSKASEVGWNLKKVQFRVSEWRVDSE